MPFLLTKEILDNTLDCGVIAESQHRAVCLLSIPFALDGEFE